MSIMGMAARSTLDYVTEWVAAQEVLRVRTTRQTQFVDVTDDVAAFVTRHGFTCGAVTVQTRHTTTGIVVNEHEPLLLDDFRRTLERAVPLLAGYAHDDFRRRRVNLGPGERTNGFAHCRALLVPSSASLNVASGELCLGRWQRVFLVELDGGQEREISLGLVGMALAERRGPVPVVRGQRH